MSAEERGTPTTSTELLVHEAEPVPPEPRRRRRLWPWIVAGVLLVLLIVAALLSDGILRQLVRDAVAERVTGVLALEEGTEVGVELAPAPMIPQLLAGRLDAVEVEIPELRLGELTGAVSLRAESVPLDESAEVGALSASFSVGAGELSAIAGRLSGLDPEQISLEDPEIVVSTTIGLFGFDIPVGLGLEPGVEAGALVFTPTSFRLGEEVLTAEQLTSNPTFAFLSRQLLQQEPVCVAELLPAAIAVEDASVAGERLTLTMTADGAALAADAPRGACGD